MGSVVEELGPYANDPQQARRGSLRADRPEIATEERSMRNRTYAPPGATHRLTEAERAELARKVSEANRRSVQGRGGGQS